MRRAGLGEAGKERTFGETLTCTLKKSTALKTERLDLEGHLRQTNQKPPKTIKNRRVHKINIQSFAFYVCKLCMLHTSFAFNTNSK